jgi:sporulation protein YlmC with PRC-barrel domain
MQLQHTARISSGVRSIGTLLLASRCSGITKTSNEWSLNMATEHETSRLISAEKVEGTSVYNTAGEKVGSIRNVMIDKLSGKVAYATMSSGGILGMGSDYYAVPWNALVYNTDRGGYQVAIERERLESAPAASESDLVTKLEDETFGTTVHDYYGTRPYWQ